MQFFDCLRDALQAGFAAEYFQRSESGGAVLRPQTATRMGSNIWPGFDAEAFGGGAQSGFETVVREFGGRQSFRRAFRARAAPCAASPFFGISSAVS